jgi:hypothetical protein
MAPNSHSWGGDRSEFLQKPVAIMHVFDIFCVVGQLGIALILRQNILCTNFHISSSRNIAANFDSIFKTLFVQALSAIGVGNSSKKRKTFLCLWVARPSRSIHTGFYTGVKLENGQRPGQQHWFRF